MSFLTGLLLSILPVVLLIGLYYFFVDQQLANGHKWSLIILGVGILSALPSYIIESSLVTKGFYVDGVLGSLIEAFFFVAFIEEFFKYVFLYFTAVRRKWLLTPLHFLAAGLIISLGFAMSENILYAFIYSWETMLVRLFTAVPSHACFGILMGYYFYRYSKSNKAVDLILAFTIPFLLHGMYDFFIVQTISESLLAGALVILVACLIWSIILIKSLLTSSLEETQMTNQMVSNAPLQQEQNYSEYDPLDKIILGEDE